MKKIKFTEEEPALVGKQARESGFKKKTKNIKKPLLVGGGLVSLLVIILASFLLLPAMHLKDDINLLEEQLNQVSASLNDQKFPEAFDQLKIIYQSVEKMEKDYQKLALLRLIPYVNRYYQDGYHLISSSKYLLEAAEVANQALMPYYDLLGFEQNKKEQDLGPMTVEERLVLILDTLDKISPQFDQINQKLVEAKKEIDQIDTGRYPEELFGKKIRKRMEELVALVDNLSNILDEIKPIVSYLKPLLGIPEEKLYFLLFQNDAELRPSGGFMTAYAFLSVHNGNFKPLSSHDIYSLDKQFGDRLKAPEPILQYLPDVRYWHLRDMNLSADFTKSMQTFWENYRQIPNSQEVDGIIALDTQVLVEVLKVLGKIGVSGWGNFSAEIDPRCDCPQVFYELEKYADQPVSTQREERKGIIGPLMHSILSNIMGSPRKTWPQFFNVFLTSIQQKHLLFYFFNEDLQKAVEALNAGGRIKEFEGDYFYLNDCNFAGAKSNMYIRQKVTQEISKEPDGSLLKKVTVDYKNPAPPSNCNLEKGELCLNGYYRDWFRIFVPKGSQLLEFSGSEVEIKVYEELGKTVFEGFFGKTPATSLRPEGSLKLTFKYRLPFKVNDGGQYRLLVQKQPGTPSYEYGVNYLDQSEVFDLDSDKELQFIF
ncbi:MAG TPA: DUF4012 domain-containing protein [Candidatus Bathyarchaeia archaeon]|nr:DUF4012 domain-containing protein [Candidatus Bathyarchaeia archaeon]